MGKMFDTKYESVTEFLVFLVYTYILIYTHMYAYERIFISLKNVFFSVCMSTYTLDRVVYMMYFQMQFLVMSEKMSQTIQMVKKHLIQKQLNLF